VSFRPFRDLRDNFTLIAFAAGVSVGAFLTAPSVTTLLAVVGCAVVTRLAYLRSEKTDEF
jgi:hypothetical protein